MTALAYDLAYFWRGIAPEIALNMPISELREWAEHAERIFERLPKPP